MSGIRKSPLFLATLVAAAGLLAPLSSLATTVQFDASGSFGGSGTESNANATSTNTYTDSGDKLVITYTAPNGGSSVTTSALPVNVSLGTIDVTAKYNGNYEVAGTTTFALNVTQTAPAGSGSFSSTVAVDVVDVEYWFFVTGEEGTVTFKFSNTQFDIGNIRYQLTGLTGTSSNQLVVSVTSPDWWSYDGSGHSDLRANISVVPTTANPEPSSLAMVGMGGLTLLGYGWRSRQAARA